MLVCCCIDYDLWLLSWVVLGNEECGEDSWLPSHDGAGQAALTSCGGWRQMKPSCCASMFGWFPRRPGRRRTHKCILLTAHTYTVYIYTHTQRWKHPPECVSVWTDLTRPLQLFRDQRSRENICKCWSHHKVAVHMWSDPGGLAMLCWSCTHGVFVFSFVFFYVKAWFKVTVRHRHGQAVRMQPWQKLDF